MELSNRRDVATRKIRFFQNFAKTLVKLGFTPNSVSVASAVFALLACVVFIIVPLAVSSSQTIFLLVFAILCIQLRLICNLLDGLMAVEGGLKTPAGELFNDVPDRISDAAIIIGASYVAQNLNQNIIYLGWAAALVAIMTAYVRTLGASLTGQHDFAGPMAKQHRMFIITLGSIGTILETSGIWPFGLSMLIAIVSILIGSTLTCVHRLRRLYRRLERK